MNGPDPAAPHQDIAHVHLELLGEQRRFDVPVALGRRIPLDLLPAAREFSRQATEVVVEQAARAGRGVSCRAGCGACCRQLVAISLIEAVALADLVEAMAEPRRGTVRARFAAATARLESAGLLDVAGQPGRRALRGDAALTAAARVEDTGRRYFALGIACPFLEDEACSIHPERPLVCREYHVSSPPSHCADRSAGPIEKIEPPLHMSSVLARAGDRIGATGATTLPLVLALEVAAARGEALREPVDGGDLFEALVAAIDTGSRTGRGGQEGGRRED